MNFRNSTKPGILGLGRDRSGAARQLGCMGLRMGATRANLPSAHIRTKHTYVCPVLRAFPALGY